MRATLGRLVADESVHGELFDELAEVPLRKALRPGAESAFRSMFGDIVGAPQPVDLTTIVNPVLALHGELDRVCAVEVSERLIDSLPQGASRCWRGRGTGSTSTGRTSSASW